MYLCASFVLLVMVQSRASGQGGSIRFPFSLDFNKIYTRVKLMLLCTVFLAPIPIQAGPVWAWSRHVLGPLMNYDSQSRSKAGERLHPSNNKTFYNSTGGLHQDFPIITPITIHVDVYRRVQCLSYTYLNYTITACNWIRRVERTT